MKPGLGIKTEIGDVPRMSATLLKFARGFIQSVRFARPRRLITLLSRNDHALDDLVGQPRRVIPKECNSLAAAADEYVPFSVNSAMQDRVRDDVRRINGAGILRLG